MSFWEWLSICSNIASLVGFFITIKSIKLNVIASNPFTKVFGFSLIFTALVFLIPWNKIHFGDDKIKIVYRDTSKSINRQVLSKSDTIKYIKPTYHYRIHQSKNNLNISQSSVIKVDTTKKQAVQQNNSIAVQNSPGSHIVGGSGNNVGINGDVNVNTPKLLSNEYLEAIYNYVDNIIKTKDFDSQNIVVYTQSYCNYPGITQQIIDFLNQRGLKASEGFATTYPAIEQIKVDTLFINRNPNINKKDKKKIAINVGRFKE